MMSDISQAIQPKSDQLNADDLVGRTISAAIENVEVRQTGDQLVSVWLVGHDRPWKPCKSMCRVMAAAWGTLTEEWIGKAVTLYNDPEVKWAGVKVGGIRISHLSHIEGLMVFSLTATRGKRQPYRVAPMPEQQPQPPQQLPPYPQEKFDTNLPAWQSIIQEGKATADQIIAKVEQSGYLTDHQKSIIRGNQ